MLRKFLVFLLAAFATPGATVFAQQASTSATKDSAAAASAASSGSPERWNEMRKRRRPAAQPTPSRPQSTRQVVLRGGGGSSSSSSSSSSASITVTGADPARLTAIEAELKVLKNRPDPSSAILERIATLEDEQLLIQGRLAAIEATQVAHGRRLDGHGAAINNHEDRITREESRGHGVGTGTKVAIAGAIGLGFVALFFPRSRKVVQLIGGKPPGAVTGPVK